MFTCVYGLQRGAIRAVLSSCRFYSQGQQGRVIGAGADPVAFRGNSRLVR